MEHNYYKCKCGNYSCHFCGGGLGLCTVCGGAEGALTKECCGYKLDSSILNAVYNGGLNFCGEKWVVPVREVVAEVTEPDRFKWIRFVTILQVTGFIPNFIANKLISTLKEP